MSIRLLSFFSFTFSFSFFKLKSNFLPLPVCVTLQTRKRFFNFFFKNNDYQLNFKCCKLYGVSNKINQIVTNSSKFSNIAILSLLYFRISIKHFQGFKYVLYTTILKYNYLLCLDDSIRKGTFKFLLPKLIIAIIFFFYSSTIFFCVTVTLKKFVTTITKKTKKTRSAQAGFMTAKLDLITKGM